MLRSSCFYIWSGCNSRWTMNRSCFAHIWQEVDVNRRLNLFLLPRSATDISNESIAHIWIFGDLYSKFGDLRTNFSNLRLILVILLVLVFVVILWWYFKFWWFCFKLVILVVVRDRSGGSGAAVVIAAWWQRGGSDGSCEIYKYYTCVYLISKLKISLIKNYHRFLVLIIT